MFRVAMFALVGVSLVFAVVGCTIPRTPISMSLYADVSDALGVNPGDIPDSPKVGTSEAMSVIGITTGDCSIEAARKAGGIKKIYYVDYHSMGILGVYAKTTTKVYGE